MRALNEALVLGSIRQHELTEAAERLNLRLAVEIAERRHAEQSVRVSEVRYRRLFEAAGDGILLIDPDTGKITDANPFVGHLLGEPHEQLVGRDLAEIGLFGNEVVVPGMLAELRLVRDMRFHDLPMVSRDGRQQRIEIAATFYHEGDRAVVQCHLRDITDRKKFELQMLRAQRLDSIGILASGMAHNLNNILAPIMMSMELLRNNVKDPAALEILDIVEKSARRGAETVGEVLAFARGSDGGSSAFDISSVIRDVVKMAADTFPKNIRVAAETEDGLWPFEGDSTRIHQVLLNFCVNSRDAMPDGGEIKIHARNVIIDASHVARNPGAEVGTYLRIDVADTGHGIPPAIIDKIFDPFFTTKEIGKGTGLGLFNALSIIKGHAGFLEVSSHPGRGTIFQIYLPSGAATRPAAPTSPPRNMARGGGRTILVVDDEDAIRQITRHTLEAFGYIVLLAANGSEAIDVHEARRNEISVMITDMMMPVMDGTATAKALRLLNPTLPVIFTSGVGTQSGSHGGNSRLDHFLSKPYTTETLLNAVNDILVKDPGS